MRIALALLLALSTCPGLADDKGSPPPFDDSPLPIAEEMLVMCKSQQALEQIMEATQRGSARRGRAKMEEINATTPTEECGLTVVGKVTEFEQLRLYPPIPNLVSKYMVEALLVRLHYKDGTERHAILERLIDYTY